MNKHRFRLKVLQAILYIYLNICHYLLMNSFIHKITKSIRSGTIYYFVSVNK